MPITVLDNARGFEEGLQYANNVFNRIQDFAKHQQSEVAAMAKHKSTMAMHKLNATMPTIQAMIESPNIETRNQGSAIYNQIANEIKGSTTEEMGMLGRDYLDKNNTNWIGGDRATGEYTPANEYFKNINLNTLEPPLKEVPTVPNNGTPYLNLPAYVPPPQPVRTGNIFDQITNPDTTPIMQRDMGENNVGNLLENNAYNPTWSSNVFDQIANKYNGTQFSENIPIPYEDSSRPKADRGAKYTPPKKKKRSA